jgi:hypothetical protein
LPGWRRRATAGELSLICNLVPAAGDASVPEIDIVKTAERNIQAVADVKVSRVPTRKGLAEISLELEAFLAEEPPAVFRTITASLRRLALAAPPAPEVSSSPPGEAVDWLALRDYVEGDNARFPHCLSTYAHLIVNGDGTTRSCCKVQSRLSSISQDRFQDIWNGENYRELRSAHAQQIAPREACRNCHDPVRFHFLTEILQTLENHDIDISLIRKPKDFPVPATYAEEPLVKKLGSNAICD